MKLVVGLGNPGMQYETTRHNVGFLLVDRLIDRWNATGPRTVPGPAELYVAEVGPAREKVSLLKPQTYMNLSGKAVGPLMAFHKCEPTDMVVIHDDLDLDPMVVRLKTGGGTGGHNGLKSIDEALGTARNGYHRVRIGVGHPSKLGLRMPPADYVLGNYSQEELDQLDPLLDEAAVAVEMILQGRIKEAMNQFNTAKKADR